MGHPDFVEEPCLRVSYFSPVLGFRNRVLLVLILVKLNMWVMGLAMPSKDT